MSINIPTDSSYAYDFWCALENNTPYILDAYRRAPNCGAFFVPLADNTKYKESLKKENFFRRLGMVISTKEWDTKVTTLTSAEVPTWVPEGDDIPETIPIESVSHFYSHKLAAMTQLHLSMLTDTNFDFENWMLDCFARLFGKAECAAFINGTGNDEPVGILANEGGAEIGITTESSTPTFDEMITLFHSLVPKYRENAVWVMNDTTALALRKLKDCNGNYLWLPSSEKLLGKEVIICNEMPDIGNGAKPIAFGDFSYYWIMERMPLAIRILHEKYALFQHRGYVGYENLDAKLIRPEAIKVMQMVSE